MQCQIWGILPSLGYDLTPTHITLEQYCVKFRIFICHPSPFKVDCLTQLSLAADKRLQSSLLLPLFWAPLCLVRFRRLHFFAPCNHKQNRCVQYWFAIYLQILPLQWSLSKSVFLTLSDKDSVLLCSLFSFEPSCVQSFPQYLWLQYFLKTFVFPVLSLDIICVGPTAWAPERREGQSQEARRPPARSQGLEGLQTSSLCYICQIFF